MKIGIFPKLEEFLPTSVFSQVGVVGVVGVSFVAADHVFQGDSVFVTVSTLLVLIAFWITGRYASLPQREGYFLDQPYQPKKRNYSGVNWLVTDHLKESGIDAMATETRSAQYRIFQVKNKDPGQLKKQMPAISMIMGVDQREMMFIQNFKPMTSAIIAPLPDSEWKKVRLHKDSLEEGRLMGYIGKSLNGEHITYDRKMEPHMLIAGDTNSGKTEAIITDINSMKLSGLNPEIYIIDPKEDMKGIKCEFYTSDVAEGVDLLERLSKEADVRKAKYTDAGCKNYFEYQERVDSSERPLMVYIDETADLLVKDLLEKVEKGESRLHERAFSILYYISRKQRAAGIFLTLGLQHPKAETLPTEIRNNLSVRLVLSMADATASKVALGQTGAEFLPKFGAGMFKTSLFNAPVIVRGAIS